MITGNFPSQGGLGRPQGAPQVGPRSFGGNPQGMVQQPMQAQQQYQGQPQQQYQGQPQAYQQGYPQQQYGYQQIDYASRLAAQINQNARMSAPQGSQVDPNGGFQGYTYNRQANQNSLAGIFENNEVISDEQMRINAIAQASHQSGVLYTQLHNRVGVYYQICAAAMEGFKRDPVGRIEPVLEQYVQEVQSNIPLYQYIASVGCALVAADLTALMLANQIGDMASNPQRQQGIMRGNFMDAFCLQFGSWLENHPQGMELYNSLSPWGKQFLNNNIDGMIEPLQNKMLTISVGNTIFPFPWKKGIVKRMMEKVQVKSPVLENYDFNYGQTNSGTFSSYLDQQQIQQAPTNTGGIWDTVEKLYQGRNKNPNVQQAQQGMSFGSQNDGVAPVNNNWDQPWERKVNVLTEMNSNNRLNYNFGDYFTRIPNAPTTLYVIDPEHFKHISIHLTLKADDPESIPYFRVAHMDNCVPVVRIDWEQGIYDYTNVPLGNYSLKQILTNPDLVLPLIEKDRTKVQQQVFEQYVKETDQMVNENNNPLNVPEMRELGQDPKVLFGNKPLDCDTNSDVKKNVATLSEYYDPKEELDAFVLAERQHKLYELEPEDNFDKVYKYLPSLVTGQCKRATMDEFIQELKTGFMMFKSTELEDFIRNHVTNVVNRWLVETRFFPEVKGEPGYLRVDDLIDDHEQMVAFFREKDPATLKAYQNLLANEFLQDNLTLFAPKERRAKFITKELNKFEGELRKVKERIFQYCVVVEREFMVVKVNPMNPLTGYKQVIIKSSSNPNLIRLMELVKEKMEKHFGRKVPILTTFGKDGNGRMWLSTQSHYDNGVYSFRPASTTTPLCLLHIAK